MGIFLPKTTNSLRKISYLPYGVILKVIFLKEIVVSKIFQKNNEIIIRISALASKMGQIGK